jgi:hypothetical protein
LSKFGVLLVIDELAGGDILKWESVLEMDYMSVLRKRQINLHMSEYKDRYAKVLRDKNK